MFVQRVWGVLPVFVRLSDDIEGAAGLTRGPVITLLKSAGSDVLEHEIVHAKQFYAALLLIAAITALAYWLTQPLLMILPGALAVLWPTPHAVFIRECAAYAAMARERVRTGIQSKDAALYSVSRLFDDSPIYHELASFKTILERVTRRYEDRRIF